MKKNAVWFSAKCLFQHRDLSRQQKKPCYEERITLVRARSFSEALRRGESEARRYSKGLGTVDYLGFITVYKLFESRMKDGAEVYSVLRSIKVPKKTFITRYYDDGTFHCQTQQ
jgi:hypothetical protein